MAASADRLVWVDCEMTGLNPERDELVEVAVIVTDFDLNPLDDGLSIVIEASAEAIDGMSDFVRDMHTTSGVGHALIADAALVVRVLQHPVHRRLRDGSGWSSRRRCRREPSRHEFLVELVGRPVAGCEHLERPPDQSRTLFVDLDGAYLPWDTFGAREFPFDTARLLALAVGA